jgi:hypothetical protein
MIGADVQVAALWQHAHSLKLRTGKRPRALAKQPAALSTNSNCKMFASPLAETCRGVGRNNPALKDYLCFRPQE